MTGSDVTSKFGTKLMAIKTSPTDYLLEFGKNPVDDEQIEKTTICH